MINFYEKKIFNMIDKYYVSFLFDNSKSSSSSTSGTSVLTTDLKAPIVSKTTVGSSLLHSFQIFSQFGI
jgi:hypothetical protein